MVAFSVLTEILGCRAEAETKTMHLVKQARERSMNSEAQVHQPSTSASLVMKRQMLRGL